MVLYNIIYGKSTKNNYYHDFDLISRVWVEILKKIKS